jgi:hypothetical protein
VITLNSVSQNHETLKSPFQERFKAGILDDECWRRTFVVKDQRKGPNPKDELQERVTQ